MRISKKLQQFLHEYEQYFRHVLKPTYDEVKQYLKQLEDSSLWNLLVYFLSQLPHLDRKLRNSEMFEIQVRTLAQELWSEMEHMLVYKPENRASFSAKRRFEILSRELNVIDEHFNLLYEEFLQHRETVKYGNTDMLNSENLPAILAEIERITVQIEYHRSRNTFKKELSNRRLNQKQEASNDLNGLVKKTVGLGSGRVFKLIIFEQAKQRMELANEKEAMGRAIEGSAGAPGVTEGLATVIASHEDLLTIIPDTILVYPHTSPVLTPVLPKIKGLVTDTGGLLAPAATIAREYGIPMVLGTSVATASINDGDVIRVDGTNGRIMIITRAQRYAS